MAEFKSYPPIVCQRCRNLIAVLLRLEKDRECAFENRDDAVEAVNEAGDNERKKKDAQAEVGRCTMLLSTLSRRIKGANADLRKTLEEGDQEQLPFSSPKVSASDYDNTPDEEDEDEDQTDLLALDPEKFAVSEIGDFTPATVKALEGAGLKTLAQLHTHIDTGNDLTEIMGIGGVKAQEIQSTVKRLMKKAAKSAT